VTLAGTASSVTFSSIPATYRDLILVTAIPATTDFNITIRLNSDSGNNYNDVHALGNGSTASSFTNTSESSFFVGGTDSAALTPSIFQFLDYSATDKHKTLLARVARSGIVEMAAGRWANTDAVSSIAFTGGTYPIGSTFSLYGVIA
jgi:hypothetical protein